MDELLSEYERELAHLRSSLGEFAERFPQAAARLAISGDHSEDLHVERLIQSAALLNAASAARIDDEIPEFTRALLEVLYSEYLRSFPSCSIAQFMGSNALESLKEPVVIQRGVELKTRVNEYCFRTAHDVVLAPLRIEHARFDPNAAAPVNVQLPPNTTGVITLTFAGFTRGHMLGAAVPETIRVFVDGERNAVAATIDALLQRATVAFVEASGNGHWINLPAVPVSAAGFGCDEALIERADGRPSPFRLLLEYFAFPDRFDFIDIDFAALQSKTGPCERMSLHLPVAGLHRDSAAARAMESLTAANFRLFCTPVVNLFRRSAEPVSPKDTPMSSYPIVPQALNASDVAVYSVDAVRASKGGVVAPIKSYQSLSHDGELYWLAERDTKPGYFIAGPDTLLSLRDRDGELIQSSAEQIDVDLTCTNRNLPSSLSFGNPAGDLVHADKALTGAIVMLRRPSVSLPVTFNRGRVWTLISMISAGPVSLDQSGLPALKALLNQHVNTPSSLAARHIEGIVGCSERRRLRGCR
ncbi:type VI secretion system baseplate subunit TssF [Paraburkholderia sp. D15]|uniref:type VI secretion system baseplate subunit TssF n=1 Tax=Paraburkholderia sp. D15 TaxID=2880218 RepID=UPI002478C6E7|nr:type VI secretion system baseplate subunit TssF [Paraburkholderia sp. D15]WGS53053.1 type VI secretion system baseplate subunit TssF [Paraburkholderia sp. D15]